MSITRPWTLVTVYVRSHELPFEQGRLFRPTSHAISIATTFAALGARHIEIGSHGMTISLVAAVLRED